MKRVRAMMLAGRPALDALTVTAAGVIVLVAVFYFSTLRPEQARLQALWEEAARARQQAAQQSPASVPKTPADRVAAFYGAFPPAHLLPDVMEKVFSAAQAQSVRLEQGEYRVGKDSRGTLTQYQMSFPVKGTYPQMRKFVAAALADVPTLSLESIKFERKKVGDAVLDAKIRFVLYLGRTS